MGGTLIGVAGFSLLIASMSAMRVSEPITMVLFGIGLVGVSGLIKIVLVKR